MHTEFWQGGHLEGTYLEDREGDGRIILAEFEGDDGG